MGNDHPVAAGLKVLAGILETQKRRGHETVNISPEAETLLGGMPRKFMEASNRPEAVASSVIKAPPEAAATMNTGDASRTVPTASRGSEKEIRACLNQIFKDLKSSEECKSIGTLFDTPVYATGNPTADVVFVGDAPGADEEKLRKPLVGPAREKLDQMLKAMGIESDGVYFSNVVKFRPKKGDGRLQGASSRPPTGDEMRVCLPYLKREIEAVRPKVIVALGKTAAEGLLDKGGSISSFRQEPQSFSGVPVVVTYHLGYVLKQEREKSPEKVKETKRSLWEDMLKVMAFAGMEISDKQRGYFK